jgi:hypothetical protein
MSIRGAHPLATRFVPPVRSLVRGGRRLTTKRTGGGHSPGPEVVLMGEAAPGFPGVYYACQGVWVPAHDGSGGWSDERDLWR